ncbi:hypothetical protein ABPG75_008626 [Micractinium tetrahymenae]
MLLCDPKLPFTHVSLRFHAGWMDEEDDGREQRLQLLLCLRFLERLSVVSIDSVVGPAATRDWLLPCIGSLQGLRLWLANGHVGRIQVLDGGSLPSLQWVELCGVCAQPSDGERGLVRIVCASTQLTRLRLERCDLAEDEPGVLASATQLRHLEMRDASLPAGCRHGITTLAQLTALHLPVHGAEWDEPLETLGPLTALRQLSLHGEDCSAQVLASLPTSLTSLSLDLSGQAGRPPLAQLERLPSLQQLWLGPAALIHGRGAARLRKAIPGLTLELV